MATERKTYVVQASAMELAFIGALAGVGELELGTPRSKVCNSVVDVFVRNGWDAGLAPISPTKPTVTCDQLHVRGGPKGVKRMAEAMVPHDAPFYHNFIHGKFQMDQRNPSRVDFKL